MATAYRPPRRQYTPVEDLLRLFKRREPAYLIADLNARHSFIGHSSNNDTGKIIDNMIRRNIVSYMGPEFNTRVGVNGISKPDIILKNRQGFFNYSIREGEITTSDHIPVMFKLSTTAITKESLPRRLYNKTNWNNVKVKINQDMESLNRTRNLVADSRGIVKREIDEEIVKWTESMKQRIEEETPVRLLTYIPHPKESDYLKLLQQVYNQVKNRAQYTAEDRLMMSRIQEEIKNENIRLFNDNWDNIIRKIDLRKNDPKYFWGKIGRLMGGKDNGSPVYIWGNNRIKLYKTKEKLNMFKETWASEIFRITEQENTEFDMENERRVEEFLDQNDHRMNPYLNANLNRLDANNFLTKPVTLMDIIRIITNFKNKAPGESGLTRNMLLNVPRSALERLLNIINILLSMGYFSIYFKNGHMIMAPKPDKDRRIVLNYRPITLLEVPAKILERVINDRLYKYMEDNNIFHINQFGFRRNLGTEMAILKLYETVAMNQRQRYQCNIVCRDVAKAFDKVWHRGLKYKVLRLQLPDIIEKIICSFLDERTAQIKLEGELSEKFPLRSGVPQGSILSPTLYIFYTSDLTLAGPGTTDVLFADDVSQIIEYEGKSKRMLARRTVREITRINEFERAWKIRTNKNKFKILSVSKMKPQEIRIENREIPFARSVNVLGFRLNRTGFGVHVGNRIAMSRGRLTKLKRFKKLQPTTKSRLYKSLIRSQIEYPNIPQCVMATSKKNKIQKSQNNVIRRFIHKEDLDQHTDIAELHERYNIEPVNKRMFRRAEKTWRKFELKEQELALQSMNLNNENESRDHYWWSRVAAYIGGGEPEVAY